MIHIFQTILRHFGADDHDNFLDPFEEVSSSDKGETPSLTSNLNSNSFLPGIKAEECNVRNPKRVRFYSKIKVVLVPTAEEYRTAGCDLWWNESDYAVMRENFRFEIEDILNSRPNLSNDISKAMKLLYQPRPGNHYSNLSEPILSLDSVHTETESCDEETRSEVSTSRDSDSPPVDAINPVRVHSSRRFLTRSPLGPLAPVDEQTTILVGGDRDNTNRPVKLGSPIAAGAGTKLYRKVIFMH
jgi:hypothetical protein